MNQPLLEEALKTIAKCASSSFDLGISFLEKEKVACRLREKGDSRYPYSEDGLVLWACSSGYLYASESSFHLFEKKQEGQESVLSFWGGVKGKEDRYHLVSITGESGRSFEEGEDRYCVYSPLAALYLVRQDGVLFALKTFVGSSKSLIFDLLAYNESKEEKMVSLSSYFNPLLTQGGESDESKWFKRSSFLPNGFHFQTVEDLSREIHLHHDAYLERIASKEATFSRTTSRMEFAGRKQSPIALSPSLDHGFFPKEKDVTQFSDTAIAGEIATFSLKAKELMEVAYRFSLKKQSSFSFLELASEGETKAQEHDEVFHSPNALRFSFSGGEGLGESKKMEDFLPFLEEQVRYGALAKASSGPFLGVRDVSQMLEGALMFDPIHCRKKILELMGFEYDNGRFPRQYSIPSGEEDPSMDNREFIDQGQWVISLLYSYLAFTGDFSILEEDASYYRPVSRNKAHKTKEHESIYGHLKRALSFLLENLEPKTGCLRILYGDWNDAVDGLGTSSDKTKEFGDGVSAMATFHLVKNLKEMASIADLKGEKELAVDYERKRQSLIEAAKKYLIEEKNGQKRIIHGFGEHHSFEVGSFCDIDDADRVGVASNAFYVIGGLYQGEKDLHDSLLLAFHRLDSRYGLKTFDPFFPIEAKAVGRIVNLPKGTAENGAVYIHGSLFGSMALLEMNEPAFAYKTIRKVLPLNHSFVSTTPFVMPNSYIEDPSIEVDGESMSDWYTGSSNTLLKMLVKDVFGFRPNVDGTVTFAPASSFPYEKNEMRLSYHGHQVVIHAFQGKGKKGCFQNGKEVTLLPNKKGIKQATIRIDCDTLLEVWE